MLDKLSALLGGRKKGKAVAAGELRSLRHHVNPNGRVPYALLKQLASEGNEKSFIDLVGYPILAGSAIKEGAVEPRGPLDPSARRKTHLFKPADLLLQAGIESESLQQALYLFARGSEVPPERRGEFVIGRIAGSDLVMPDFAVSERHAQVSVTGEAYYIADLNSTNGTRVNGRAVGAERVRIADGDTVTIGRYDFAFLFPKSLYALLTSRKTG